MEIDQIKTLSKSALTILTEYIDLVSCDLYNLVDYMYTDKYKSFCDLSNIISNFSKDNIDEIKKINLPINSDFSVDYYDLCMITHSLDEFKKNCKSLINGNESFYKKFLEVFDFNSNVPLEIIICSIYKNYNFLLSVLRDSEMMDGLKKFYDHIDAYYNQFMVEYFLYKQTQSHDDVLNRATLSDAQIINYEIIDNEKLRNKKIIYIDQNIISDYCSEKNKKIRSVLNSLKESGDYVFVFSPHLVEDGIKMDYVYFKAYLAQVLILTDGVFISKVNNKLCYVKEDFNTLVNRVVDWLPITSAAEKIKYYKAKYSYFAYPYVRKDNRIVSKINGNISGFFSSIDSTNEIIIDDRNVGLYDFLQSILLSMSGKFCLEDLKAGKIVANKDFDYIFFIEKISEFLDVINYKTERMRDKQKILSSYQDIQHLAHAWKADYFLTNDDKLIDRGNYIYGLLGVKTKFVKEKEIINLK